MAIGVGVGLALAASGWTATKIAQWAEAKIASIEASTFHTQTVTAALAASTPAAAPAAAPVAPAAS
jgi:hypothetical protein